MTTTTNKGTTAKTTAKSVVEDVPEIVADDIVTETETNRIPKVLADSVIFNELCLRYLSAADEIAKYNAAVMAEKDSEWNGPKVIDKARELGRPADPKADFDKEIRSALEEWESAVNAAARLRKTLLDTTAGKLGINLSSIVQRDPEHEAPLKEKRKEAHTIGTSLNTIAGMTQDVSISESVLKFLADNELPSVGRNQAHSFSGDGGGSTPKYRVNVMVTKDGVELLNVPGFTKAGAELTKSQFGYERGKAPKSDTLRTAWEARGNTPEKTVVDPVEFDDNGLHFKISKK